MLRRNHYETAFAAWLRECGVPYVAVNEARRSSFFDESLKNLDFIVSPPGAGESWLVDVKGRRFPTGAKSKQYWKNWTTGDELKSLARWEELFGAGFTSLFVFAFQVVGTLAPLPPEHLYLHGDEVYAFTAVRLDHFAGAARRISPRWDTLAVPAARFRELARPAGELFRRQTPISR